MEIFHEKKLTTAKKWDDFDRNMENILVMLTSLCDIGT